MSELLEYELGAVAALAPIVVWLIGIALFDVIRGLFETPAPAPRDELVERHIEERSTSRGDTAASIVESENRHDTTFRRNP